MLLWAPSWCLPSRRAFSETSSSILTSWSMWKQRWSSRCRQPQTMETKNLRSHSQISYGRNHLRNKGIRLLSASMTRCHPLGLSSIETQIAQCYIWTCPRAAMNLMHNVPCPLQLICSISRNEASLTWLRSSRVLAVTLIWAWLTSGTHKVAMALTCFQLTRTLTMSNARLLSQSNAVREKTLLSKVSSLACKKWAKEVSRMEI